MMFQFLTITATPRVTPTPIPIDGVPAEFKEHMFYMFIQMFAALKKVIIPFTHVSLYEVLLGTIAVSCVTLTLKLMFGKGGGKDKA